MYEPYVVDESSSETVTDSGEITTPAGTFDALEITSDGAAGVSAKWFGIGVGLVQSDRLELTEVR